MYLICQQLYQHVLVNLNISFEIECPDYNRKAKYVIDKLLQLRNNDSISNISPMAARLFAKRGRENISHRPLKAVIFSQFRAIYEYFGDRLIRRFGVSKFYAIKSVNILSVFLTTSFFLAGHLRSRLFVQPHTESRTTKVHS